MIFFNHSPQSKDIYLYYGEIFIILWFLQAFLERINGDTIYTDIKLN